MKRTFAQSHIKRCSRLGLALLLVVCMLLQLTACMKPRLATPTGVNIEPLTLTLSWNEVTDAAYYTVRIEGEDGVQEADSGGNSYSLERLSEGRYTVAVKAVAGAKGDVYADSEWSKTLTFSREAETGLSMRLTDSNTAYEVFGLGVAQGDVVIPDTYRGLPVTSIADGAFSNKSTLTSVVIGSHVREIGAQAFANCSQLTSVTLPASITSIGAQAFQNCRAIAVPVALPDALTSLGERAFEYCRKLPAVTFGSGLKEIPANAFNGCEAIETVVLPDGITAVGDSAFSGCTALASVTLGDGVQTLGASAFSGCTALSAVAFGGALQEIGASAFSGCVSLAQAALPEAVVSLGASAFSGCEKLASVTFGDGMRRIGRDAFAGTPLTAAPGAAYLENWFLGTSDPAAPELLEGTVGIADYAFASCESFPDTVVIPDSVRYLGEGAFKGRETLINVILGSGVEEVGDSAFEGCTSLTAVRLGKQDASAEGELGESSLRSLGERAFYGCESLSEITMPDTLERVGVSAFEDSALWENAGALVYAGDWAVGFKGDETLTVVTLQDGTAGIAEYAFYGKDSLTRVDIPESVNYIGRSAFYECASLERVTLPSALTVIEDYTFYHCDKLILPELPQGLVRIGRSAFYRCNLVSVLQDGDSDQLILPESLEEVGDYAFYGCTFAYEDPDATGGAMINGGIDSVVIGGKVTRIGARAFAYMASLKAVILGSAVTEIGERAFYRCEELSDVTFGSAVEKIGERAFYGCGALKKAELPAGVREIGDYAFYQCTSLASVTLGNTERIGHYAFFGCTSLTQAALPATLTFVGSQAFRGCTALTSVTLRSYVSVGAHAFYGCSALTVYTDAQEEAQIWNTRWNSSYRPVVWGCTVGEDGELSFSYGENSISNLNGSKTLSAPCRAGYAFAGWATSPEGDPVYAADLAGVPSGTTLYAVFTAAE